MSSGYRSLSLERSSDRRPQTDEAFAVVRYWNQALCLSSIGLLGAAVTVVFITLLAWHRDATRRIPYKTPYERSCSLFCEGPVLHAVQTAHLFPDGKEFVDMPARIDPAQITANFLSRFPLFADQPPVKEDLLQFVNEHFDAAGSDVTAWTPSDWQPLPPLFEQIKNPELRLFAIGLNDLWLNLGQMQKTSVKQFPERHSLMHLPHEYIVPGGRFREVYNWDSLWIIRGLLKCNMIQTAIGMARNLLHLVSTLHFVPNGNRVYYAVNFGRSQPPVLTRIILEIAQYLPPLNATAFVAEAFHICQLEHSWWMQTEGLRPHAIYVSNNEDSEEMVLLSRYASDQTMPRPESWSEDLATVAAAGFSDSGSEGAKNLFGELAASAESGYDFSSRFFANGVSLATCDTSQVIPVDLQAMLLVMENDLSIMAKMLAEASSSSANQCVSTVTRNNMSSVIVSPYSSQKAKSSTGPVAGGGKETLYCKRNPTKAVCVSGNTLTSPIQERAISSSVAAADRIDDWLSEALKTGGTMSSHDSNICACELHTAFTIDADRYSSLAVSRSAAIDALMWSDDDNQWRDLRIVNSTVNKGGRYVIAKRAGVDSPPYASNWMPLWAYSIARSLNNATRSRAAANALAISGLVDVGGVFVSLESASGQQWDWPNAFAPLQSFLYDGIMGTTSSDDVRARELASVILHRWIKASMNNFLRDGILNEKNDARFDSGISGRGGEYQPQLGFGWSIGVSLDFIFQMMNETENPRNFGRKLNLTNNLQK